ncbi:MAG: alpha/beta hydrolase [Mycobacteriaceae bacterium]
MAYLDIGDIKYWDPTLLEKLVKELSGKSASLEDLQHKLKSIKELDGWRGAAKDAAQTSFDDIDDDLTDAAAAVGAVKQQAARSIDDMLELQLQLRVIEAEADSAGLHIQHNGSSVDLWAASGQEAHLRPDQQAHREIVRAKLPGDISALRARAMEIDDAACAMLHKAADGGISDGGATTIDAAMHAGELEGLHPPAGFTDSQVARWWGSLSSTEQQLLLSQRPEWVGNLDGVPGSARDVANRNWLSTLESRDLNPEQRDTLAAVREALFNSDGTAKDGRQLLVLDLNQTQPAVAIALGNVDTADHISVYVPGTGGVPFDKPNSGNDLPTYVTQASGLKDITEKVLQNAGSKDTVATVAWIGYETPPHLAAATTSGFAENGAPKLASFVNGLDSSRPTDPHLTMIGHSYGSLVASEALQRNIHADDVIFTGSPGLEANSNQRILSPYQIWNYIPTSTGDLHLAEGHVFVEQADKDWITDSNIFSPYPISWNEGFTNLSTDAATTPLGDTSASSGHSEYFNAGTTAMYNQALVIAGLTNDPNLVPKDK